MNTKRQWDDISYLKQGTARQQQAYDCLLQLNIFEILSEYTPVLVGTIPLDIDIPSSDLDIICEVTDLDRFEILIQEAFGGQAEFSSHRKMINSQTVIIARFQFQGFPIEIFGQPCSVKKQNAYRHMLAEWRLLALATSEAKQAIRQLKKDGFKTEPAFGKYFALSGDSFKTLYQLANASESVLEKIIVESKDKGLAKYNRRYADGVQSEMK